MHDDRLKPQMDQSAAEFETLRTMGNLRISARIYQPFKRFIEFVIAFLGLIVLTPIMILVALLIRLKIGSPVFFTQKRPGLHGNIITIIKFRTMSNALDPSDQPLPDEQRLPPLGRFLRATSIDELPQLWCVLRGDMSLIGPRPLLIKYLPLYSAAQQRRHLVRPGITGLAQINGRNSINWPEKLAWDVRYVDNLSLSLDIYILFMTVIRVLRRDGVTRPGFATTMEFTGNPPTGPGSQ